MLRVFYCDPCGDDRGWPRMITAVSGLCGFCGEQAMGNHIPREVLPQDPPHPRQLRFNFNKERENA